ncbi:MAG: hypothetical protein U9N49_01910 [Campylobacterota bacterium]|nr:hypothetical protein [Campylobacterota bacterium]
MASGYYDDVVDNFEAIEEDFLEFFPHIVGYLKEDLKIVNTSHLF